MMKMVMKVKEYYLIGELAKYFGISCDTLRIYDKMGILPARKDKANGYRYYTREDLICLDYILRLRQAGIFLENIKRLVNEGSLRLAAEMMQEQSETIQSRLVELNNLYRITQEYLANFNSTIRDLDTFSIRISPRMICSKLTSSAFETMSTFSSLVSDRVPRLSFITPMNLLNDSRCESWLTNADPKNWKNLESMILTDEGGNLTIPTELQNKLEVIPPRKCLYAPGKCYTGKDYYSFIKIIRYVKENHLNICGDMISITVSLRNNIMNSVDYYQSWLPVE